MKRPSVLLFIFALALSVFPTLSGTALADPATTIRLTPPAPKHTEAERHAEQARRRAAVAARMSDKSMMILFSTEPKLYAFDVDYVYRQENNLYYLTYLNQDGATLVITKD